MNGVLYEYDAQLQCFESGKIGSEKVAVLLGGLTDGLLFAKYCQPLSDALEQHGFALVQVVLRSSYCQFGTGTLERDLQDLEKLVAFLRTNRASTSSLQHICLVGHSTGCQISCWAAKHGSSDLKRLVKSIVLQAPVSDREYFDLDQGKDAREGILAIAKEKVASGHKEEIIHMLYGIAPVNAERFIDLFDCDGRDDMFSSDLSMEQLRDRIGHLDTIPTLICLSGKDQYAPDGLYPSFQETLQSAVPSSTVEIIPDANHELSHPGNATSTFISKVVSFLANEK